MENFGETDLKLFWVGLLSFLGIARDYLVVFPGETWFYCVVMQAGFSRRFKSVQFESFAKGLRRVKGGFKVVCYRIIKDGRHIIFFVLKHPSAKPSQKVMRWLARYNLLEGNYLGPDFFAPEGNTRHPGNGVASAPSANSAPCSAWPNNLNNNYDHAGDDPAEEPALAVAEFDPTNESADTIFSDVEWLAKTEDNGDPSYEGEQDWQSESDLAHTNHHQEAGPDPKDPEDKTSHLGALAQMEGLVLPDYDEFGDEILSLQLIAGDLGLLDFAGNNTNAQQQNLQFYAQNNNNAGGTSVSAPTQLFGCVSDQDWIDQNAIFDATRTEGNDELRRKIKSGEYLAAEEILQHGYNNNNNNQTNNEVNPYFTAEGMIDEFDYNIENTDPTS